MIGLSVLHSIIRRQAGLPLPRLPVQPASRRGARARLNAEQSTGGMS